MRFHSVQGMNHCANMPMQYAAIFNDCKNVNFTDEKKTEVVLTSTHNIYLRAKKKEKMYARVNPNLTIIKVVCKGVYMTQTC